MHAPGLFAAVMAAGGAPLAAAAVRPLRIHSSAQYWMDARHCMLHYTMRLPAAIQVGVRKSISREWNGGLPCPCPSHAQGDRAYAPPEAVIGSNSHAWCFPLPPGSPPSSANPCTVAIALSWGMLRRAKQMAGRKCEHERRAGKYRPRGEARRRGRCAAGAQAARQRRPPRRTSSPQQAVCPCAASGRALGQNIRLTGCLSG